MRDSLKKVFDMLPTYDVGIVGSAIYKPEPKDIDVVFSSLDQFKDACKILGVKFNSWDANYGKVYRANIKDSKIQLIHIMSVTKLEDHPHEILLRDGRILHEGVRYVKPASGKYEKGIRVDRRKEMTRIVAIDFDGTIRDWNTSKPFPGVKEAINRLREKGYKIIIHSCNEPDWIKRWMNDYDLRFDYIWGEDPTESGFKPAAQIYIDDRGFRFSDWTKQTDEIINLLESEKKADDV